METDVSYSSNFREAFREKIASMSGAELKKSELIFISKTIKLVMADKQINQTELSKRTKIPVSVLSRYENGSLIPDYQKLAIICDGLNVDFISFLVKCFHEKDIQDDRARKKIEEYEPIVENAKRAVDNLPILPSKFIKN